MSPPAERHQLKFTGTCGEGEFRAKCQEHDFWYHSYHFDNGFVQRGDYDIGLDIAGYGFPQDMAGMQVLDIGTGSGWFSTYFEQLGAEVVTADVRGWCDYDVFGRHEYPHVTTEKSAPDRMSPDGQAIYYSPTSRGFWIMKEILGLQAKYVNARVYHISPELFHGKKFDLVFMGSVLMHVRDPIGALMAARSVCRGSLIATTYILPDTYGPEPVMRMWEGGDRFGVSWWKPNQACLIQWLKASGFAISSIEKTVRLTTDKPYRDSSGRIAAADQEQQLVHACVEA